MVMRYVKVFRSLSKFVLDLLIHTTALKELAQHVVGNPNEAECRLKQRLSKIPKTPNFVTDDVL